MPITLESIVVRTAGLMSTALGQDVVILNSARDNYVGLDEVGRRVWGLLVVPRDVKELCRQVTMEFEGDSRQIAADILAFLNELAADGLVNVAKERSR
jgi:hypothetical protein